MKRTIAALVLALILLIPALAHAEYVDEDVDLLARLLYSECRGEPEGGQRMVAQCVMDRLKDGSWGGTLSEVINYPGQFAKPAKKIGEPQVFERLVAVAEAALDGERYDDEHTILYFRVTKSTKAWYAGYLFHVGRHAAYGE